jgi:hypothetical protein
MYPNRLALLAHPTVKHVPLISTSLHFHNLFYAMSALMVMLPQLQSQHCVVMLASFALHAPPTVLHVSNHHWNASHAMMDKGL